MLFGYPAKAIKKNWLHDCLFQILESINKSLKYGRRPPTWPFIIPERYRDQLKSRDGLKKRLQEYQNAVKNLSSEEIDEIIITLHSQNKIRHLLSCKSNCKTVNDLPDTVQEPIKKLFRYAFDLLSDLGIRNFQYRIIYQALEARICPFCGCEDYSSPLGPKEDLDHYMAFSLYPFAAVNLNNLVPMGGKCNSKYKLANDLLSEGGIRRRVFNPYHHKPIRLSLDRSTPFAGEKRRNPLWQVDFEPNSEEVATWDTVFRIRERYQNDYLDPNFTTWMDQFAIWHKEIMRRSDHGDGNVEQEYDVVDLLDRYTRTLEQMGYSERAFLKAAVFRMLLKRCKEGDDRVILFIKNALLTKQNKPLITIPSSSMSLTAKMDV